jgi:hypothetical protein
MIYGGYGYGGESLALFNFDGFFKKSIKNLRSAEHGTGEARGSVLAYRVSIWV